MAHRWISYEGLTDVILLYSVSKRIFLIRWLIIAIYSEASKARVFYSYLQVYNIGYLWVICILHFDLQVVSTC